MRRKGREEERWRIKRNKEIEDILQGNGIVCNIPAPGHVGKAEHP